MEFLGSLFPNFHAGKRLGSDNRAAVSSCTSNYELPHERRRPSESDWLTSADRAPTFRRALAAQAHQLSGSSAPPNLAVAVMAGIIDRHLLRPCTDAQGAEGNDLPRN